MGTPDANGTAARAVDAVKTYGKGEAAVHALAGVTVDFPSQRLTAIMGPPGSGKTTLGAPAVRWMTGPSGGQLHGRTVVVKRIVP